jgi:ubiquinone/menaquinone biosynthesis C-methylase UbiE
MAYRFMRRSVAPWLALLLVSAASILRADDAAQAAKLFELLELKPGMAIADIGAGSGEMTVLMAARLGPSGKVFATDINEDRLKEIRAAAAHDRLDNVVVLEGAERETNLPLGCCDAIFIRHVYHHFPDPGAMNRSLLASLKPGGRLAIIDFVPRKGSELPNGAPASRGGHGITSDMLRDEVVAAGFTAGETVDHWDGSNGVYLVVFRKP